MTKKFLSHAMATRVRLIFNHHVVRSLRTVYGISSQSHQAPRASSRRAPRAKLKRQAGRAQRAAQTQTRRRRSRPHHGSQLSNPRGDTTAASEPRTPSQRGGGPPRHWRTSDPGSTKTNVKPFYPIWRRASFHKRFEVISISNELSKKTNGDVCSHCDHVTQSSDLCSHCDQVTQKFVAIVP